jgi:hypothetical protein
VERKHIKGQSDPQEKPYEVVKLPHSRLDLSRVLLELPSGITRKELELLQPLKPQLEFLSETAGEVEISSETAGAIGRIPEGLKFIYGQLDVAREGFRPQREIDEALARAGSKSCSMLSEFLGDMDLWQVLYANYRNLELGSQATAEEITEVDVPATAQLLVDLGFRPPEDAERLVRNAKELLDALIARGSTPTISSSHLIVATQRAMDELQKAMCSRADQREKELRTAEGRRRHKITIEKATTSLALYGSVALQFEGIRHAVWSAVPQVPSALGQVAGAVWQGLAAFGPIVCIDQANEAIRAAQGIMASKKVRGPMDRQQLPALEERVQALQERIESANTTMESPIKFSGPRDLVGRRVFLERSRPGDSWKSDMEFEIAGPIDKATPFASSKTNLPLNTEEQITFHYRFKDTGQIFTAPKGPLTDYCIRPIGDDSHTQYYFNPVIKNLKTPNPYNKK